MVNAAATHRATRTSDLIESPSPSRSVWIGLLDGSVFKLSSMGKCITTLGHLTATAFFAVFRNANGGRRPPSEHTCSVFLGTHGESALAFQCRFMSEASPREKSTILERQSHETRKVLDEWQRTVMAQRWVSTADNAMRFSRFRCRSIPTGLRPESARRGACRRWAFDTPSGR